MEKILIAPSILSADFSRLGDEIKQIEDAGADWIHIDVMDGQFVPNISMGPFIIETCRRISALPLDVHLMIERPENHIKAFINAGASSISIHIEGNPNVHRTMQEIHELGCKVGIAINPATPAIAINEILDFTDLVLVMSVNPGFSGQSFIPQVCRKIEEINNIISMQNYRAIIQIDGGISRETLPIAHKAGVTCFVAATSIFRHPAGIHQAIQELRTCIE
jgi:ribulose-phosphate 3-epimerase